MNFAKDFYARMLLSILLLGFTIASAMANSYDGKWKASAAPTSICSKLAWIEFVIKDNNIVGFYMVGQQGKISGARGVVTSDGILNLVYGEEDRIGNFKIEGKKLEGDIETGCGMRTVVGGKAS